MSKCWSTVGYFAEIPRSRCEKGWRECMRSCMGGSSVGPGQQWIRSSRWCPSQERIEHGKQEDRLRDPKSVIHMVRGKEKSSLQHDVRVGLGVVQTPSWSSISIPFWHCALCQKFLQSTPFLLENWYPHPLMQMQIDSLCSNSPKENRFLFALRWW